MAYNFAAIQAGAWPSWPTLAASGISLAVIIVLLWRGMLRDYFGVTEKLYTASKEALKDCEAKRAILADSYATALVEIDTRRRIAEADKQAIGTLEAQNESLRARLRSL